ncbi:uncharacterized protein LOC111911018 [Lactuca sativa]|uniref:uncharacterized protein LOC111911018 n=1 Tax=Lactuca sativa TaxID=4236 RepID=UPI000CD8CC4E|nr:uncharacterized protein LOC111911018 [Lactuca sativa]
MDRETWMYELRHASDEYLDYLNIFLKAADDHRVKQGETHIWCPCKKCHNCKKFSELNILQEHLICYGFMNGYTRWTRHGESFVDRNMVDTENNGDDIDDSQNDNSDKVDDMLHDIEDNIPDKDYEKFQQMFDDAEKPLLKRLFANAKDAKLLRWHADKHTVDEKLRHVADSPQWENIDYEFKEFGGKIRNIRFGLSSDGINPFGNMSSSHSTWPVLLCIYNLPPWLCMKRKYIMMPLPIQGPKQPGNDIDVFLAPLIEEMKLLWKFGAKVYDAFEKEYFQLHGMIFCTISDFPAYANLSGYSTKGKKACPVCEKDTVFLWLGECKKHGDLFDGKTEKQDIPDPMDGKTTFSRVQNLDIQFGKRNNNKQPTNWKKRSIFWELPYWEKLEVRHCLDVMHIEKNVCDALIALLLDIYKKSKDGINIRRDMVTMGIRPQLAPIEKEGKRTYLPPACHTLSKDEKTKFCKCLHDVKVPSGYSSKISKLVSMKDLKLMGMKSHDFHVLITHMIPIAIRGILRDDVRHAITKLCLFF